MKKGNSSTRNRHFVGCFLITVLLLFGNSVKAQVNLLKNGDFESAPIGVGSSATNWSVLYLKGCADDFEIKDRTRSASLHSAWFGAEFRPRTQKPLHACFTQTVTGLQTNHQYTVDGQMWTQRADKAQYVVYIEAIGGTGDLIPDGRRSVLCTNVVDGGVYANGNQSDNQAPLFEEYASKQTPDVNGKIEIRLHFCATTFRTYDKMWQEATYFDDIVLFY